MKHKSQYFEKVEDIINLGGRRKKIKIFLSHYIFLVKVSFSSLSKILIYFKNNKRYHKLLSIIYVFDKYVSRPVRFTLYYM